MNIFIILTFLLFFTEVRCGRNKQKEENKDIQKDSVQDSNDSAYNEKIERLNRELIERINKEKDNPKKTGEPSVNKKILNIIEEKKKKLIDDVMAEKEIEQEGKNEDVIETIQAGEEDIIKRLKKTKNITLSFDEFLNLANTKMKIQKKLKYVKAISCIDFVQLDLFEFLIFLRNIYTKDKSYFYEVNLKLFNIFWGFKLTTGLDCGVSVMDINGQKNNVFFLNVNLGYKYLKYGHFELTLGGSRVKYKNIVYWPLWFAVTPFNFSTDIYKMQNSPIAINLNIKLLFKGLITEDMADFTNGFRNVDDKKIIPFIGYMSNPSILNTFVDLKIFLGFRFYNED